MKNLLLAVVGLACYAVFFLSFGMLLGFVAGVGVPWTVDGGEPGPWPLAVAVDLGLISLFGLQHSVMARQGFKAWWTRIVPKPIERSLYVLASSGVLILLMAAWQPLPAGLWSVDAGWARTLLWGLFGAGIAIVLWSSFLIDHLELFGLKQVICNLRNQPHIPPAYAERWLYRLVRHPLYVGWLMFVWMGPQMSVGRALFAAGMTAYIVIAIRYEERDLVRFHGQDYVDYQRRVPALIPRLTPAPRGRVAGIDS